MTTFASAEDVATRLGRDLDDVETGSVDQLLDAATSSIAQAADKGDDWDPEPVPSPLKFLAIELTVRALANPSAATSIQKTLGQASVHTRFAEGGGGLQLSEDEQLMVRRVVYGSNSGSSTPNSALVDDLYPYPPWSADTGSPY